MPSPSEINNKIKSLLILLEEWVNESGKEARNITPVELLHMEENFGRGKTYTLVPPPPPPPPLPTPIPKASRFELIYPRADVTSQPRRLDSMCREAVPSSVLGTRYIFGREMQSEMVTPGTYVEYISAAYPFSSAYPEVKYYKGQGETSFYLTKLDADCQFCRASEHQSFFLCP